MRVSDFIDRVNGMEQDDPAYVGDMRVSDYVSDMMKEILGSDDDQTAWCVLEESESEQRHEVSGKKSRTNLRKDANGSLLSMENRPCETPKKVVEVKSNWA